MKRRKKEKCKRKEVLYPHCVILHLEPLERSDMGLASFVQCTISLNKKNLKKTSSFYLPRGKAQKGVWFGGRRNQ
jgi:hypothetical protein